MDLVRFLRELLTGVFGIVGDVSSYTVAPQFRPVLEELIAADPGAVA